MDPKPQSGGRELNEISAPSRFHFKPVFYCQKKINNPSVNQWSWEANLAEPAGQKI
jgi:hypothetical protein